MRKNARYTPCETCSGNLPDSKARKSPPHTFMAALNPRPRCAFCASFAAETTSLAQLSANVATNGHDVAPGTINVAQSTNYPVRDDEKRCTGYEKRCTLDGSASFEGESMTTEVQRSCLRIDGTFTVLPVWLPGFSGDVPPRHRYDLMRIERTRRAFRVPERLVLQHFGQLDTGSR